MKWVDPEPDPAPLIEVNAGGGGWDLATVGAETGGPVGTARIKGDQPADTGHHSLHHPCKPYRIRPARTVTDDIYCTTGVTLQKLLRLTDGRLDGKSQHTALASAHDPGQAVYKGMKGAIVPDFDTTGAVEGKCHSWNFQPPHRLCTYPCYGYSYLHFVYPAIGNYLLAASAVWHINMRGAYNPRSSYSTPDSKAPDKLLRLSEQPGMYRLDGRILRAGEE